MRRALIWSFVWVAVCLGISVAVLVYVANQRIGGPMTPERASAYGSGIGMVTAIGLAPIWWIHFLGPLQAARLAASKQATKGPKSTKRTKRKP